MTGLGAIFLSCLSSGFAGVYFEKILKNSKSNLWVKNVQLAIYGIAMSSITLYTADTGIGALGFFYGYTEYVSGVWYAWL